MNKFFTLQLITLLLFPVYTIAQNSEDYYRTIVDEGESPEVFIKNENKPVAIPFRNNLFGQHPYMGNHMSNVLPGQTMYDANDALIFLKPLEETKFSAQTDFFYTDDFKKEVERRIRIIQGPQLDSFLEQNGFETIGDYVEKLTQPVPEKSNPTVI
ncbi:MAG: hypothetical protein WD052_01475 [Bacteroidales bacterium]